MPRSPDVTVATLKALVFKPGKLSAEYFAGRRASYIGPVRLYLTFSLMFFLVLALEPAKSPVNQVHGKNASQEEVRKAIDEEMHKADFTPNSFYGHLMRALLKASEEPEVARHNFLTNASRAEFFMVPVFAFGLMLAYKNRKKHYPTFIYFSLHFHAFAFCATTLRVLARLTNLSWLSRPAGIVVLVWIAVYLFVALRRTFGGSRINTLLRMAGLTVLYLPCYFIALVVVALITIYTI